MGSSESAEGVVAGALRRRRIRGNSCRLVYLWQGDLAEVKERDTKKWTEYHEVETFTNAAGCEYHGPEHGCANRKHAARWERLGAKLLRVPRVRELGLEIPSVKRSVSPLAVLATLACSLVVASPANAQRGGRAKPPKTVHPPKGEQIAWFATLESARAEAKRRERPILLISARPACKGVPGFW